MDKYSKLIEFIINEQEEQARELFHTIVVERSRQIYESLIDETDLEGIGGNQVDSMVDEITNDEEGVSEDEDFDSDEEEFDDSEEDFDDSEEEFDDDGDLEGEEEFGGEEGELEDRVMDLEDALDELKAEFDALMSDGDGEDEFDADDVDDVDDVADDGDVADDMGDDEVAGDDMSMMPMEAKKKDVKVMPKKDAKKKMTEAERIREYAEKIGDAFPGNQGSPNGSMVGTGHGTEKQGEKNTKSVVAGKNDMGGTAHKFDQGGANQDPSGTPSKNPSGLLKQGGELIGKVQNRPGGDAGKTGYKSSAGKEYSKNHGAEGQTTSGKVTVNSKSVVNK